MTKQSNVGVKEKDKIKPELLLHKKKANIRQTLYCWMANGMRF